MMPLSRRSVLRGFAATAAGFWVPGAFAEAPLKGSKTGELAARFEIVMGFTPAG